MASLTVCKLVVSYAGESHLKKLDSLPTTLASLDATLSDLLGPLLPNPYKVQYVVPELPGVLITIDTDQALRDCVQTGHLMALILTQEHFPIDMTKPESICELMRHLARQSSILKVKPDDDRCSPFLLDPAPISAGDIKERETALDKALRTLEQFAVFQQDHLDRSRVPKLLTQAAPGCGKTAFIDYLARTIHRTMPSWVAVSITFNGGMKQDKLAGLGFTFEQATTARVLFSAFFSYEQPGSQERPWNEFSTLIQPYLSKIDLQRALEAVLHFSRRGSLLLCIDEIFKGACTASSQDSWYAKVQTVFLAIDALGGRCIAFVTSLDGRLPPDLRAARMNVWIQLPLLTLQSVKELLESSDPSWPDYQLKALSAHSGGHPRIVQAIDASRQSENFTDLSYLQIVDRLQRYLSSRALVLDYVPLVDLRSALLGMSVFSNASVPSNPSNLKQYRDLVARGQLLSSTALPGTDDVLFKPTVAALPLYFRSVDPETPRSEAETVLKQILQHSFNLSSAEDTEMLDSHFELFHALWEVLVRRLLSLQPALARTWGVHYGHPHLGTDYQLLDSSTCPLPARLLVLPKPSSSSSSRHERPSKHDDPLSRLIQLFHSEKGEFVDHIDGRDRCSPPTICIRHLLLQRVPLVVYPGKENNMPAFDLLTIDWNSCEDRAELTFIQSRGARSESAKSVTTKEVCQVLYHLKALLAPYVTDPDNLFSCRPLANFTAQTEADRSQPGSRKRNRDDQPHTRQVAARSSSSSSGSSSSSTKSLLPSISLSAAQIRMVFAATRFGAPQLAENWGTQVAVLPWEKLREVYGASLSQLVSPTVDPESLSEPPKRSQDVCSACSSSGHRQNDLQCSRFEVKRTSETEFETATLLKIEDAGPPSFSLQINTNEEPESFAAE